MPTPNYNTLEDIELRKDELRVQLQGKSEKIGGLWRDLFLPKTANTKGELIANLISNSVTAIDAFLLVRKLMKTYSWLFLRKKR